MKVAVIGSGGREHALVWRLGISPSVEKVYAIPGSSAMQDLAEVVSLDWENTPALLNFLKQEHIDLVVVGPEAPLVAGLTDTLEAEGMAVFGPSRIAAQLEGSKSFAKALMKKYHIPTADYEVFSTLQAAKEYVRQQGAPIVIKADGLAAGKGVVVAMTLDEALAALDHMLGEDQFGEAGSRVVIEEFMEGEEASLLAFADGKTVVPMIAAQDHKRIFDGDKGPNTGGMGAYAPAPVATPEIIEVAQKTILEPVLSALAAEGATYKGCLYAGLMITKNGPRVVEFNARFGDPETQVVLPLLEGDLGEIMMACAKGNLTADMVNWKSGSAACVIMASAGYPETSHTGDVITGNLDFTTDSYVFHSGTTFVDNHYETNGGRVLGITTVKENLQDCLKGCYDRVMQIKFNGAQYRTDIGQKAFK